ncbi:MAG: MFS transporter, partial [Ilumatobacteraceae bacterium]
MPSAFNLRKLIAASAMSNLADGVFQITLPLVTLGITRDPRAFASVTFVGRLPWLLVALPAGALADRLDRRRTMTLVNFGRAAIIAALCAVVAADLEQLWALYVVAFVLGVGETMFDTAAQSILPNIVNDPDQLSRSNGRLMVVELTTNQFIGPPIGAVIAGATLAGALGLSAIAYLVAGAALLTLSGQFRPKRTGPPTRLRSDVAEGIGYLASHRLLRALAVCVGISNLASTAMFSVLPLYIIDPGPVGLSAAGFGLLVTTTAAGSVAGSALVPRLEHHLGPRKAILLAAASFPLFSLAPAITTSVVWIGLGFFFAGALSISWNIITVSLRQRIVPDHLLGRVNAGYRLLAWGTMPLGAAVGGLTAAEFGLTTTFWTATVLSALCVPIVLVAATNERLQPPPSPSAESSESA